MYTSLRWAKKKALEMFLRYENIDAMKTVIVFGNDHANSVGVIQSLGIAGYQPVALLFGHKTGLVEASKYTTGIVTAKDAQACIDKLLKIAPPYTEKQSKIPIIACCDIAALTLESNTEKLKYHFLFEHSTIIHCSTWQRRKTKSV